MIEVLSGGVVALLTLAGTWLTARAKRKSDSDTTDISWFEKLSARLDEQQAELDTLRAEVGELRMANIDLRVVLQAFVAHVRSWRRMHPDRQPAVPDEVAERMGDSVPPTGAAR